MDKSLLFCMWTSKCSSAICWKGHPFPHCTALHWFWKSVLCIYQSIFRTLQRHSDKGCRHPKYQAKCHNGPPDQCTFTVITDEVGLSISLCYLLFICPSVCLPFLFSPRSFGLNYLSVNLLSKQFWFSVNLMLSLNFKLSQGKDYILLDFVF